jgi:hypothetical protein
MAKLSVNKDLIVLGNTMGAHRINDIGVSINYGQAVRLSPDQVSKSSDLVNDLRDNKITIDDGMYPGTKDAQVSLPPDFKYLKESVTTNTKAVGDLVASMTQVVKEFKDLKGVMSTHLVSDTKINSSILDVLQQLTMEMRNLKVNVVSVPGMAHVNPQQYSPLYPMDSSDTPIFVPEISNDVLSSKIVVLKDEINGSKFDNKMSALKKIKKV